VEDRVAQLMSMPDAVAAFVPDGATIALEGFTHLIPFAAGHELIRQGRRHLTLVRLTPDLIYDHGRGRSMATQAGLPVPPDLTGQLLTGGVGPGDPRVAHGAALVRAGAAAAPIHTSTGSAGTGPTRARSISQGPDAETSSPASSRLTMSSAASKRERRSRSSTPIPANWASPPPMAHTCSARSTGCHRGRR